MARRFVAVPARAPRPLDAASHCIIAPARPPLGAPAASAHGAFPPDRWPIHRACRNHRAMARRARTGAANPARLRRRCAATARPSAGCDERVWSAATRFRHLTLRLVLSKSTNEAPRPHSRCRHGRVPPARLPALVDRAGGRGRRPDAAGALPSFQVQGSAVPRRDRTAA